MPFTSANSADFEADTYKGCLDGQPSLNNATGTTFVDVSLTDTTRMLVTTDLISSTLSANAPSETATGPSSHGMVNDIRPGNRRTVIIGVSVGIGITYIAIILIGLIVVWRRHARQMRALRASRGQTSTLSSLLYTSILRRMNIPPSMIRLILPPLDFRPFKTLSMYLNYQPR
ncbi:hypothetical protein F4821DRAFT_266175 [Hypoxylon rubiginosum]|uniref:Uncharacterized protein n=1 Tax=Hypoxylon rubiginosum TaxID=110542 RepID=A0ACC0CIC8_9PEZI|nr:hypothetical protein F4821DRAFT_266175 [Hypoxylon rubiginosum]